MGMYKEAMDRLLEGGKMHMAFPMFSELATELQIIVLGQCEVDELLALGRWRKFLFFFVFCFFF